jgi:pyruvate dehydrogenase (quinone)
MKNSVSDFIIERLAQWNIRRIFGYPGDGIDGLMGAVDRAGKSLDYIRVRHEEMSAFMACAHAKFTGQVGACIATSGPGAIHLLAGLYDAKLDHVPVVALIGQQPTTALGSDYLQEVDLHALFQNVSAYTQTIMTPAQAAHVIDRAIRIAAAERTVTCVIVPNDVQLMDAVAVPPHKHAFAQSGVGYVPVRAVPDDAHLHLAADVLNACSKIAVLVGAGAIGAEKELIQLSDVLGCGIAKALLGKEAIADHHDFVTGSIGLLGTKASLDLMEGCDGLLLIGTTFPYAEYLPKHGQARAVQIDIDPKNIGMRYATEVNLVGDSADVLRRLLPLLRRKQDRAWLETVRKNVAQGWKDLEAKAMEPANPINPQRPFWELSPLLPDRAILCGDSGSSTNWFARDVKMREGMKASLSGKLASMGSAVPYAIAAKMAYPDRPVIAIAGDGAMQMNGLAELITVKQYASRWQNPSFIVMVLVNNDLNEVTWEQRALAGDPKFDAAQTVEPFPYAKYAELLGFEGIRIDQADEVANGWKRALSAKRPVLIEFVTDPDVPPLPPHISFDEAKRYMHALPKEKHAGELIKETARQVLARFAK